MLCLLYVLVFSRQAAIRNPFPSQSQHFPPPPRNASLILWAFDIREQCAVSVCLSPRVSRLEVLQEISVTWRLLKLRNSVQFWGHTKVEVFMEKGVRGRASRHNKKARYFTHPFFHKYTLMSTLRKRITKSTEPSQLFLVPMCPLLMFGAFVPWNLNL